jgi:hypothetical protein
MPLDYSKWNNLDLSDDSDDEAKRTKAAPKKRAEMSQPTEAVHKPAAPKDAAGSAWNASNYHWEEKQLDKWGSERLRQLFAAKNKSEAELVLPEGGLTLDFSFHFSVENLEADVWSHIRKGKSVVGYNIELELNIFGKVRLTACTPCGAALKHTLGTAGPCEEATHPPPHADSAACGQVTTSSRSEPVEGHLKVLGGPDFSSPSSCCAVEREPQNATSACCRASSGDAARGAVPFGLTRLSWAAGGSDGRRRSEHRPFAVERFARRAWPWLGWR